MKKKKFFISDIDGTLYRNKTISLAELKFLSSLPKNYQVILATGRNYAMFKRIINDYNIYYDYCILNNGALIMDRNDSLILNLNMKTNDVFEPIQNFIEKSKITLNVTFSYLKQNIFLENVDKTNFFKCVDALPPFVNSISLEINTYISLEKELKELTDKIIDLGLIVNQNKQYFDISPLGSGKANSIICLVSLNETNIQDSIIVGDDLNDKEMLTLSPHSYCLRTGNKMLYSIANNIIDSVEEILL